MDAITLAKEINVQKVILETDSQVAARKVLGDQKDLPANGQLVEEIKVLLGLLRSLRLLNFQLNISKRFLAVLTCTFSKVLLCCT